MSAGESITQMIFFITAVVVASMLVFSLNSNFQSFMNSLNSKAKVVSSQVATAIKIINDPCHINHTLFVKNIGSTVLNPNNTNIIVNGVLTYPSEIKINTGGSTWVDVSVKETWEKGFVVAFNFTNPLPKDNEINRIKVITESGIYDEIVYSNSTC